MFFLVACMVHTAKWKPASCNGMFIIVADSRGSFIETVCGDMRSYYKTFSIER